MRLAAVSGAVLAFFGGATKLFADVGDRLQKMAIRTTLSVESLSQLRFPAEQSGTSLDAVSKALLRMNRRLGRITAGEGTATHVEAMEALGLSAEKLNRMNVAQRFMALVDAMAGFGDQAAAAGLAQRAFGTEVDKILPLLMQGSHGIRTLMERAHEFGLTVTRESADAAAEFTDRLNIASHVFKTAAFSIGEALAPEVTKLTNWITETAKRIRTWIDAHRETIVYVAKLTAGVAAALEGHYGELGITVDRATGRITGMSQAWDRLTDAMSRLVKVQILQRLSDIEKQWKKLQEEEATAEEWWLFKDAEKVRAKMEALSDEAAELRYQLERLKAGAKGQGILTGGETTTKAGVPVAPTPAEGMAADQAEWQERMQDRLSRLRIQGMEDEHRRALALIDQQYQAEIREAREAGREITKLEEACAQERINTRREHQRRQAEERAAAEKQLERELARAKIEASLTGHDRRMAFLKREEREALKRARA